MRHTQTQVNDWMTRDPLTVKADAKLVEAYQMMVENEVRRLPVVNGELVGIITLSDIFRVLPNLSDEIDDATRLLLIRRRVQDVMTYDPVTVDSEDTIQEAAERMLEYQVSGLPVISGGVVKGIITESDIFRLVVESWANEPA